MRGRKPKLGKVLPFVSDREVDPGVLSAAIAHRVSEMKPPGLAADLDAEYVRVATILAHPSVGRLEPQFVDTIVEYCRATLRMRYFRDAMPTLNLEVYRVKTRNGDQVKTHPYVAQFNETWRQWRSLVAMLGLSPADERNLIPGQGDLLDALKDSFSA